MRLYPVYVALLLILIVLHSRIAVNPSISFDVLSVASYALQSVYVTHVPFPSYKFFKCSL